MGRKQDFSNSIIYHIRHMESKEVVYVGSTTNFFIRKAKHKYLWNKEEGKEFTRPIYCHIRNNGGFDFFEVIPIQSLKLENKTQLLIAEQAELDKHQTLVNSYKAHTTIEEQKKYQKQYLKQWREDHQEERKQHDKKYRETHKEQINELSEKWKEKIQCDFCSKRLSKCSLYRHLKICQSKPKEEK